MLSFSCLKILISSLAVNSPLTKYASPNVVYIIASFLINNGLAILSVHPLLNSEAEKYKMSPFSL